MSRLSATERLSRLLSIIPWVAAQESASIDEIGTRFDYPRAELLRDLDEVVFMVGVYPFTPDMLIEVDVTDDQVAIRYADWFSQPMQLSPEQRVALVVAGSALLARVRDDREAGPLLRALAKLELANPGEATVDVRLASGLDETIAILQQAIEERRAAEIDYYSLGRDERVDRVVEPWKLFSADGHWYLAAWCHMAAAERTFRVDRVRAVELLDMRRSPGGSGAGDDAPDVVASITDPLRPRVVLDVAPDISWVAGAYPFDSVERRDDGRLRVTMPVASWAWLDRLLLRLGAKAEVVATPDGYDSTGMERLARRILDRYGVDYVG